MFLVKHRLNHEFYAMKIANKRFLKKKKLGRNKNVWSILEKEIAIMKKMVRPRILPLNIDLSFRIIPTS